MNQPTDHNRESRAANADLLGEDARFDGTLQKPGQSQGEVPPGAADRNQGAGLPRGSGGRPESGAARAGHDINQAGFLKDEEAAKP